MPFEIVRNDIANMQVDAIVNAASRMPMVGYGVDFGIHSKAGPKLLEARKKIGCIAVGDAAVTPGYSLDAKYVIHAVGPVWQGGAHGEERLLRQCYDRALHAAEENGCESIAFPLLAAGNHGFPEPLALQIAVGAFSSFLMEHEMQIYLVVFGKTAFGLSEKLFHSVASYIDEHYIRDQTLHEFGMEELPELSDDGLSVTRQNLFRRQQIRRQAELRKEEAFAPMAMQAPAKQADESLEYWLGKTDAGFSETLLALIDRTGKKDSEIYKKANVDRRLFSKIRNNTNYQPSKATALAFAIALELSLDETRDFIGRAGYALTHSSKFDIIVEYFIRNRNYNMFEINETLFAFDQSLLGA